MTLKPLPNNIQVLDDQRLEVGSDQDYWFVHSARDLRLDLHSRDVDGADTGGRVLSITDGTDDVNFQGLVTKKEGVVSIPFNDCRVHDNLAALLPVAAAADDMGNVPGTVGTTAPSLQGVDFGGGSTDEKCTFQVVLPDWYEMGQSVTLEAVAGMLTTISDGTATLDCECWVPDYANDDGTVSTDLCTTTALSINSLVLTEKDFTINPSVTGHQLQAGNVLQFRLSFGGSDTGNAGAMIPIIRSLRLRIGF